MDDSTTPVDLAARTAAAFDHHSATQAADPHSIFKILREACPIFWSEQNGGHWGVTRFDDCEAVLHDTETFSSRSVTVPASIFGDGGFPVLPPITLDGEAHRNFRKIVMPAFSPKTIDRWEGITRETCREFIEEFAGNGAGGGTGAGSCDAAQDYARRIPIRVVSIMVGIPPEDEGLFSSWIHRLVDVGGANLEEIATAGAEMMVYFAGIIADHRANPRDDLLTILINAEIDGDSLSDEQLLGFLFLMITAGMDTTWSVLGDILCHLGQHPGDRARIAADPGVIPAAIEEMLRVYSPAVLARVVTRDVDFRGVQMKAGQSVLICYPAANRDPRAFADPERVDFDRYPNRHVGFGLGTHRCLGVALARMELRVALEEWFARIPDFEVSAPEQVRWGAGPVRGPKTLPVRFPPMNVTNRPSTPETRGVSA